MRLTIRKVIGIAVLCVLFIPYLICGLAARLQEKMIPFVEHIHVWMQPGKYMNVKNRWWEK
jgi:hypothetical protein